MMLIGRNCWEYKRLLDAIALRAKTSMGPVRSMISMPSKATMPMVRVVPAGGVSGELGMALMGFSSLLFWLADVHSIRPKGVSAQ